MAQAINTSSTPTLAGRGAAVIFVRIHVQLIDDGDDVAAGGARRDGVPDLGQLRPGGLAQMLLQVRQPPVLDLAAVPEPRKRWWQRSVGSRLR